MGFTESVSVQWVLVPVVVRDRKGYRDDLEKDDFRIYVDGREVPVGSFETGLEAPTSLLFLQDLSGSMANGGKLAASRRALDTFLADTQPEDQFALATFRDDEVLLAVPFGASTAALRREAETWEPGGTTALHDAVAKLPALQEGTSNAKRYALVATDGADNASRMDPQDARDVLRRAELPVYVLGIATADPFGSAGSAPPAADAAGPPGVPPAGTALEEVLHLLAHNTGGRYLALPPPQPKEQEGDFDFPGLSAAVRAIQEDLRHQYVLGFPIAGGDTAYREIRVEVASRRQPLRVLYRRSYRGGEPAATGGT